MNTKNPLPPGYRSYQDFILHYHQNNVPTDPEQHGPIKSSESVQSLDSDLKNSSESFKKEICMKKIPESKMEAQASGKRNFYERAKKSDIHPSILLNPAAIPFKPIAKF